MASRDYEEFIAALNAHGVRYMLIGAHAVAFHARPRATKDLDILVEPTRANARKVLDAMQAFFGGVRLNYTIEDVMDPDCILQLGVAPVRIDVLSALPGCPDFPALWKRRVEARFGRIPTHYIGCRDLIGNKESTGRLQDRADVEVLQRAVARASAAPRSRPGLRKARN